MYKVFNVKKWGIPAAAPGGTGAGGADGVDTCWLSGRSR